MNPATPGLTLSCFGKFRVVVAGRDVTAALPGRQGRTLVAYLTLNAARPLPRDQLVQVLWPKAPPAAPDAAFASVLAKVRRALGPSLLPGREMLVLQVPPDARLDVVEVARGVDEAERALSSGDPATALDAAQHARGVLAEGLLPEFQGDWVETAREAFAALALRADEAAVHAALALGGRHLATAERASAAILEREPFRETGYALSMEVQARRGNAAAALRTFERLRVLLRDELGVAPSPEVVALHDRLLGGGVGGRAAAPRPVPVASPPGTGGEARELPSPAMTARTREGAFVGRGECLELLRSHWEQARGGRPGVVMVVGEPGIGKTRLAARLAEVASRDGGVALYGRADADALIPYQPFAEALGHLLAHATTHLQRDVHPELEVLGRLFPGLGAANPSAAAADEDTLRFRAFEAVVSVLRRASRDRPLLLVLDDLHWADKPTLLLMRHVIRHSAGARVLVLGTFRDVELDPDHPLNGILTDLRRDEGYERVRLLGFDEETTGALLADRLPVEFTPGFARRLHEQTEGNPFFIEETVRVLIDAGVPVDGPIDEGTLERVGVPEGIEEVIVRRARQLSPLAAKVLTTGSVVGRAFPLGAMEHLVDAPPEEVITAVEEAMAAGLVVEDPDRVESFTFSHALVREVLYGQLISVRRVFLHHRVATVLEELSAGDPVNPAELAHHFALARHIAGPEPARRYAVQAGRRAAESFAYEDAAAHFRRALELAGEDEREQCEILLALGRVEWHGGDDHARSTFLEAAENAAARGDADHLARAALGLGERYFEVTYLGPRYRDLLEQALSALGPGDSPRRALLLSRLAVNLAFPSESERGQALAVDAAGMARRLGDRKLLGAVLLARHVTLLDVRHVDERLGLGEEFASLVDRHPHPELEAELQHWRMYDLLTVGDMGGARRAHEALEALAARLGQPLLCSLALGARGLWAELAGEEGEAERCANESLRHARSAHTQDAVSSWASQLFALRRRQGRLGELADVVERLAGSGGHQLGWRGALGVLRFETGDVAGARAVYERELRDGPARLPRGMFWLTRLALLSELCAMLGDRAGAEALYAELAPYATRNVVVAYCSFWGSVEGYLALLARTLRDQSLADRHARTAMARVRALPAPLLAGALEARERTPTPGS
jgi:DNA-binding SARP family transcriptional activator